MPVRPPEWVPRRRFVDRGRRALGAVTLVGLAATLVVVLVPGLKLAYRSVETHVAIETAATLIPALAAVLFAGRALRGSARTDLVLAAALGTLAATNLCFSVLPALIESEPGRFSTWAPAAGRLFGAFVFTAAAVLPDKRLLNPQRDVLRAFAGVAIAVGVLAVLAALFADNLPRGIDPQLSPESANRPLIVGHAAVLAVQVVTLLLYAVATIGFLLRAEETRDGLLVWVAVAASLSALARLNYFLFPSLYSEWVYVGDFLRLASYIALLTGLGRELLSYQRQAADVAVFEERRRLARELHDGLAQELAFIRSEGARLSGTSDPQVMRMATAAERALGEARMAISSLTTPANEPLEVSLRRAAEAVAGRMGASVEVRCDCLADVTTAARQALERIVREASGNAVRHGQAKRVRIEISSTDKLHVNVVDNGRGFDLNGERSYDSFGLISMRERAEGLGGSFKIESAPGEGTTVRVAIPQVDAQAVRKRRG